jgi:hypothetical protein
VRKCYETRILTVEMTFLAGVAGYMCADLQRSTEIRKKLIKLCVEINGCKVN